jgi:hypothetical protein
MEKKSEAMEKEGVDIPEGKTEEQPTGMWEGMRGAGPELLLLEVPAIEKATCRLRRPVAVVTAVVLTVTFVVVIRSMVTMIVPLLLCAANMVMLVLLSLNDADVIMMTGGRVAGMEVVVDVVTVVVVVRLGSQVTVCRLAPGALMAQL